jgi:hypothetical protein
VRVLGPRIRVANKLGHGQGALFSLRRLTLMSRSSKALHRLRATGSEIGKPALGSTADERRHDPQRWVDDLARFESVVGTTNSKLLIDGIGDGVETSLSLSSLEVM